MHVSAHAAPDAGDDMQKHYWFIEKALFHSEIIKLLRPMQHVSVAMSSMLSIRIASNAAMNQGRC